MEKIAKEEGHRADRMAGVVLDGNYLIFVRKSDASWREDPPVAVTPESVIRFLRLLLPCTGGKSMPIQPEVLGDDSGGVIVTWIHKSTIYTKRLNSEGRPLWSEPEFITFL